MGSRVISGYSVRAVGQFGVVIALAGLAQACGGDEQKDARVASMVATPSEATGEATAMGGSDRSGAPVIEAIEIRPKRPIAGARLSAKARFAPGTAARSEIAYQWRTGTGRVLGDGRELDTSGLEPGTTVEVVATPVAGDEAGVEFSHRFKLADAAKQIALVVIDAAEGKSVGSVLRAVVETTDESDGFDVAALEWRVGGQVVGEGEELETASFAPGDVVELRARLSGGGGRPIPAEPMVLERSAPPEIRSTPTAAIEGGLFRYAIDASSPARGAKLRFELLKGPQGMRVDPATGVVEWRPETGQRGRFDVEVGVLDQWGSGVAQSFAIQADPRVAPPASAH